MKPYTKNRRKNYFIDKSFQFKFIIKFCIIIILTSLIIGGLIYYLNQNTTTVAFENLKVVVKTTADFLLPITLQILLIVTILASLVAIGLTLFTSHKIAGPLFRLTQELNKMKNGDFSSKINIRAKDQLQKVIGEFNELRVSVNKSVEKIKTNWDEIKSPLNKYIDNINNSDEKKKSYECVRQIESEIKRFKTQ